MLDSSSSTTQLDSCRVPRQSAGTDGSRLRGRGAAWKRRTWGRRDQLRSSRPFGCTSYGGGLRGDERARCHCSRGQTRHDGLVRVGRVVDPWDPDRIGQAGAGYRGKSNEEKNNERARDGRHATYPSGHLDQEDGGFLLQPSQVDRVRGTLCHLAISVKMTDVLTHPDSARLTPTPPLFSMPLNRPALSSRSTSPIPATKETVCARRPQSS